MIREIVKDTFFLSQKAEEATINDINIAKDLIDTLEYNDSACVGMAANMIGFNKAIIIVNTGFTKLVMFNPKIIKKIAPYETEEGCLSLVGTRKTIRHKKITVEYQDINFKKKRQEFSDFVAEIIEHEVDHLNGILI